MVVSTTHISDKIESLTPALQSNKHRSAPPGLSIFSSKIFKTVKFSKRIQFFLTALSCVWQKVAKTYFLFKQNTRLAFPKSCTFWFFHNATFFLMCAAIRQFLKGNVPYDTMCPRDTQNYCSLFNQHTLDLTAISVFENYYQSLIFKGDFDIHVGLLV